MHNQPSFLYIELGGALTVTLFPLYPGCSLTNKLEIPEQLVSSLLVGGVATRQY